jgi:protein phosphatase
MDMQIRMAGATNVGRKRKANQDSLFFDGNQGIGIVADGIGGRKGGEIASSLAVGGLHNAFVECDIIRHEEIHPFLISTIDHINSEIIKRGQVDAEYAGMGTTLNCLLFVGNQLHIAHVGDSRTYLYYQGNLWQLTIDHNVKTFLARGWMTPQNVIPGSSEGALVRALGLFSSVDVDFYTKTVNEGEIYLTASDGLFDMVNDSQMLKILKSNEHNFEQLPQLLIQEANRQGGRDNITVLLSKILGQ